MSGYVHCKCRDCFEIAIDSDDDDGPGALCSGCFHAGCGQASFLTGECQRSDAYGTGDDSDDDASDAEGRL